MNQAQIIGLSNFFKRFTHFSSWRLDGLTLYGHTQHNPPLRPISFVCLDPWGGLFINCIFGPIDCQSSLAECLPFLDKLMALIFHLLAPSGVQAFYRVWNKHRIEEILWGRPFPLPWWHEKGYWRSLIHLGLSLRTYQIIRWREELVWHLGGQDPWREKDNRS